MTQSKPSIAIVEDDSDQLHSIEEFLLDSGYSVWGACSAEAFYKGFTVQPVDVVLLDLGLPGEDGLSVASLLKSRPEVGVIILSARDSLDDRLAGMRAGADRYLVKSGRCRLSWIAGHGDRICGTACMLGACDEGLGAVFTAEQVSAVNHPRVHVPAAAHAR